MSHKDKKHDDEHGEDHEHHDGHESSHAHDGSETTAMQMVEAAKEEVPHIDCEHFLAIRESDKDHVLLDVREESEWEEGHIEEAIHIPRGLLEFQVSEAIPDKSQRIVLCCAKGGRSALAAQTLKRLGYQNVQFLEGGYSGYCQEVEGEE
jgi:rhodanese-related sulfurtransferase